MLSSTLLMAALIAAVTACDQANMTWANSKAKIMSLQDPTELESQTPPGVYHQVSGYVKVLDGCRFEVTNFTIVPSGTSVFFYAIPTIPPTDQEPPYLARIVGAGLGSYNGQSIVYSLQPSYSWSDIAVVLIWSEQDRVAYGAFGVNGKVIDHFKLPTDVGSNLQFDPSTWNSAATLLPSWWLILSLINAFG